MSARHWAVVSTAFAPDASTRLRCESSVAAQDGVGSVEHVHIDASKDGFEAPKSLNLYRAIMALTPDTCVALVDGDDYLLSGELSTVDRLYEARPGLLVTYGQYVCGRPGLSASPYGPYEAVRRAPWRASHLKTFRAAVFHRMRLSDFTLNGPGDAANWLGACEDLAIMFALLEMAGFDRSAFNPTPVYFYDYSAAAAWRDKHGKTFVKLESAIRALPRYAELPSSELVFA